MKIGIEAQRLFRKKKHGMEIVALETIQHLQQLDRTNEYVILTKADVEDNSIVETSNFKIDKSSSGPYPLWEQVLLPKLARRQKLSLLHCTSNTAPLFCRTPMVITIHDLIYMDKVEFKGSAYQNFGNLYRRFIVPRVAKKAVAIITVSEFAKKMIAQRLRIHEENITVVYNGVSANYSFIKDENIVTDFKKKNELPDRFFLHFANTAPRKNTIGVLKAYASYCKQNADCINLVLTNCDRDFLTSLLTTIDIDKETISKIVLLGYVAADDIAILYNAAGAFIYPSFSEGFGMPVIEAMACGTPVITSNTTSLPEVAGDAAVIIDPANTEAIAAAMKQIVNDKILYHTLQNAGLKNAERFSWENAAAKTLALYNSVNKK